MACSTWRGTVYASCLDERYVYLLPDVAHRAVLRVESLKFNTPAIGGQLKEDGWLIPVTNNLTVQHHIRGIPTRLWELKADVFCDSGSLERGTLFVMRQPPQSLSQNPI
jgi:hypothetical protein